MPAHALGPALDLGRVQLRVDEAVPPALDLERRGGDLDAERAVHVGGQHQARGRGRRRAPVLRSALAAALCGGGARAGQRHFGEAVRNRFQLQQRRQHDVHVRIAAARLVDPGHARGRQHDDGDGLRDGRLALGLEVGRVGERVVGVGRGRGRRRLLGRDQRNARREAAVDYRQRQVRDVILFRQTDRRGRARQGGAERALQRGERDLEVDGIGRGRGFHGVIFEDGVLPTDLDPVGEVWEQADLGENSEMRDIRRMKTWGGILKLVRPYLCARALLRNDGEADLLIVEPDPNHFAEQGKR